uniref:Uncharacterized protein n=1 Tax=Anguilla anguilla TaxID=7936 RepID=A0A0E9W3Q7_ANGAN
MYNLFSPTS